MTTTMPESHNIKSAVKWISSELQEESHLALNDLIQQAILRYDLSPLEAEFLARFYQSGRSKRPIVGGILDGSSGSALMRINSRIRQVECPPACRFETGECA